jgi:hypothetical protein
MKNVWPVLPFLLFAAPLHAACKTADFSGAWVMYQANLDEQHTGRCEIKAAQGKAEGHCKMSNGFEFDVQGPVTVDRSCGVSLQLDFTGGSSHFDLQLARNRQSFAGQWDNTFGTHGISSGVRR